MEDDDDNDGEVIPVVTAATWWSILAKYVNGKLLQAVPTYLAGSGMVVDNQSNAAAAAVCNVYVYVLYLALSPKFDSLTDAAHTHRMLAWGKMENTKCIYIYVCKLNEWVRQKNKRGRCTARVTGGRKRREVKRDVTHSTQARFHFIAIVPVFDGCRSDVAHSSTMSSTMYHQPSTITFVYINRGVICI